MTTSPSRNTSSRLHEFFSFIEPLEARIAPAPIIVTTLKDITTPLHDSGSLRDAIFQANASTGVADTISFEKTDGTPLKGTIKLATDLPAITDPLTITGPVAGKSSGLTINGNKHQIFSIVNAGDVTMTDLTVKNGQAKRGAGILIDDAGGTITLTNLTITGNKAVDTTPGTTLGGGVAIGGGTVTISKSKISGNSSIGLAGDVANPGGNAFAGGIFCSGTLTLVDSLVSGNVAQGGKALPKSNGLVGGDATGGGIYCSGAASKLTVKNSIVSGNKAIGGDASAGAKGGNAGGNGGDAAAGGIYNYQGTVDITNSIISGNTAKGGKAGKGGAGGGGDGGRGGDGAGGGIANNDGTGVTIGTSIISGNTASPAKGAAGGTNGVGGPPGMSGAPGFGGGGGILSSDDVTVSQCTVTKNSAATGGGLAKVGDGAVTIEASTFSKNKASIEGGGIYIDGGALTVKNSTVAGNSSGISGGGVMIDGGTVKIHNSTVAQNTAKALGGGIRVSHSDTPVEIISTIIAGNKAKTDADLQSNVGVVASFSLIQKVTAGSALDVTSHDNLTNVDPLLGTLKDNGGTLLRDGKRILTIMPKAGSPVIDKGSNPDALTLDQRGTGFNRTQGNGTDIGAVETG